LAARGAGIVREANSALRQRLHSAGRRLAPAANDHQDFFANPPCAVEGGGVSESEEASSNKTGGEKRAPAQ